MTPTTPSPTPTPAAADPIVFGPYSLDRAEARLLRAGEPVPLTPKAFDVLHLLASKFDRLVTKQELLATVWPDVLVSDASVKVCVREIRKALADDADAPRYIQTVHRRGYRFVGRSMETPVSSAPAAPAHPYGVASPPPAPPGTTDPPPLSVSATPESFAARCAESHGPFVGRDLEMNALCDAFARTSQGARQCVFVTGGPGSGKTAVLDAFAQRVRNARTPSAGAAVGTEAPALVLAGHCFQQFGMSEPYMPIWEAIARAARECVSPAPQLAALLARHAAAYVSAEPVTPTRGASPPAAVREPRSMSERLLREIADAIESLAADAPLVLLIEDVHWADYSTLDLISALARRRTPCRLMVVATYRPGETASAEHPLGYVVAGLLGGGMCLELPLPFLDEMAAASYLAERFGGTRLPAALARRLHQRTEGHPLFLVDLANDLVERGVIARHKQGWRLNDAMENGSADGRPAVLDGHIPRTVRAMIGVQLARLNAHEREVIDAAAVAGVEFSAAAVATQLGVDAVAAERACEQLARRHHLLRPCGLAEWPDGTAATRYRFAHELYHNVVYEHVSVARRARMHLTIGARLEAAWGERATEAAAELAMHFEAGRDWPRAVRYTRHAALAACRQYAHREAVHYLRRAMDLLERLPASERCEHERPLLMALAVNLQVTQGFAAAEVYELHARAHALSLHPGPTGAGSRDIRATFPVVWGMWLFHKVRSDLRRADEMSRRLLALAHEAGDASLLLQAHQSMCVTNLCLGNPNVTWDHMEQAVAIYDPALHATNVEVYGQDPGVATLAFGSVALWMTGRPEEAARAGRRSTELARRLGQPSSLALATHFSAMLHQLRGDVATARKLAQATIDLATEEGFSFWLAGGVILRGWADAVGDGPAGGGRRRRGGSESGIAEIRRGVDAWLATGSRTYHTYFLGLLADALLHHQRPAEALGVLDEALAAAQDLPEGLYEAELHRLKALALVEADRESNLTNARASLTRAVAVGRAQSASWLAARAGADLASLEVRFPSQATRVHR